MFPTDDLIEKLKICDERLLNLRNFERSNELDVLIDVVSDMNKSIMNYFEWKKKPFMDSFKKDIPKEFLEKK